MTVYKKTFTYTAPNEEEVTEDLYFHFFDYELVELEYSEKGGLDETMKQIIASDDQKAILDKLKYMILLAYGKQVDGGRKFEKSEEHNKDFVSRGAFSAYAVHMITTPGEADTFIRQAVPRKLSEQVPEAPKEVAPRVIDANLPEPTAEKDIREMSREELMEAFKNKNQQ